MKQKVVFCITFMLVVVLMAQAPKVKSQNAVQIAYIHRDESNKITLEITNYEESTDGATEVYILMSWSPDGKYLAYRTIKSELGIYDVEDNTSTILSGYRDTGLSGSWSPDGTKFAFDARATTGNEMHVFVYDITQEKVEVEIDTTESDFNLYPAWSPDGTKIVYVCHNKAEVGYSIDICVYQNGESETVIRDTNANLVFWLPNDELCFLQIEGNENGYSFNGSLTCNDEVVEIPNIYIGHSSVHGYLFVTSQINYDESSTSSPPYSVSYVAVHNLKDGSVERFETFEGESIHFYESDTNGEYIATVGVNQDGWNIYLINTVNGTIEKVSDEKTNWSPLIRPQN